MENIHFVLLDQNPSMIQAWESEVLRIPMIWRSRVTIKESPLSEKACERADCIVSPANSYARLDGSYNEAISDFLFPDNDEMCTELVQNQLYKEWKGYQPVLRKRSYFDLSLNKSNIAWTQLEQ